MITAIVVAYNSNGSIIPCLKAAFDSGVDRVIIWDNNPEDGLTALLKAEISFPGVEVHTSGRNLGFGSAINKALEFAGDDDLIILLNPDCIVNAECVSALTSAVVDPETGLVSPRMKYESGDYGFSGGSKPSLIKELLALTELDEMLPRPLRRLAVDLVTSRRGRPSYNATREAGAPLSVDWVSGFCVAARVSTLREVDGFDPEFFLYFEDVDISLRVGFTGRTNLVVRDVSALHYESTSMSRGRKSKYYREGMWTYFRKHGTKMERATTSLLHRRPRGGAF